MFNFSLSDWIGGSLACLVFALVSWGVWRSWRKRPQPAEPRCARCHYLLVAMASDRCPECGSLPATTGIIPARQSTLDFRRLALWSVALVIAGILCGRFLDFTLLAYRSARADAHLAYRHENTGKPFCDFRIQLHAGGWSSIPAPIVFRGTYFCDADRGTFEYAYLPHTWTFTPNAGRMRIISRPLTIADIQALSTTSALHPAIADELRVFLNDAAGLPDITTLSVKSSVPPVIAFTSFNFGAGPIRIDSHLKSGYYLQWLCFALWGLALPYIRIWRGAHLAGDAATRHLREFSVVNSQP